MTNLITVAQTVCVQRPADKSGPLAFRLSRSLKVIGTDTDDL